MQKKQILFIGCGKMGSAIIQNLLKNDFKNSDFTVLKPSKKNLLTGIKYFSNFSKLPKNYQADLVIFAFKPQDSTNILPSLIQEKSWSQVVTSKTIFVSILAGKKTTFFENILGKDKKIIRLMPNLPTLIGEGIFGYYSNANLKKSELTSLKNFLNGIGKNIKLADEKSIDAVTAVSGSGPAYLFSFANSMIDGAIKLGLDKKSAAELVQQTIIGSAKMLPNNGNLEDLINSVASKGGTTEAALEILNKNNQFKKIIFDAMDVACKKSVILGSDKKTNPTIDDILESYVEEAEIALDEFLYSKK